LLTYHKTIITKVPALEQYKNKEAKKDFRQKVIGFVIGAVVTVIGVIIVLQRYLELFIADKVLLYKKLR